MRLDHLLSREPILWETSSVACWVVLVVFLCLHVFTAQQWVVGVGALFWVGHKKVIRASTLSGSRSTPCERPLPVVVVVACAASLKGVFFWVWVVCGGLFVICIVVASIFVLYCFLCFV